MKFTALHSPIISPGSTKNLTDPSGVSVENQAVLPGLSQLSISDIEEDTLIIPDHIPLVPTRRLVVLVPDGEIDETAFTRRVWQLAVSSNLKILYLSIAPQDTYVPYQRSRLAGLVSMTTTKEVKPQMIVCAEKYWSEALKKINHPGDLVVCLASHKISRAIVWQESIGEYLARSASVPMYWIGSLKVGLAPLQRQRIKEILAWLAAIVLMSAFFALQVALVRTTARPLSTILLSMSVLVELYLLWKINEWIG